MKVGAIFKMCQERNYIIEEAVSGSILLTSWKRKYFISKMEKDAILEQSGSESIFRTRSKKRYSF